jgi:nucleoside-diphosphate-sugar epimerase
MPIDAHGNSAKKLVVFGCGYVGTAVARAALARGMTVSALTRNPAGAAILNAEGVRTVVADLAADGWHQQLTVPVDFVLDCVGSGGNGIAGYRHSYYGGMRSILRWAKGVGGFGTCVYTSSTAVYPQGGGQQVRETDTDNETAPAVRDLRSEKQSVLRETEQLLAGDGHAFRRWFVLRLAGIYGPQRTHLLTQVRAGSVTGTSEHQLNIAHRDDVVSAILACFDAPAEVRNEVFNVADDGAATKREVAEWLAARIGVRSPQFTGTAMAGRTAVPDRIVVNAKLKDMLGWQPRFPTFREGYDSLLEPV